jgi:hypothetical protein
VEAGFAKRIMFGSDFPDQVGTGIDAIRAGNGTGKQPIA